MASNLVDKGFCCAATLKGNVVESQSLKFMVLEESPLRLC